MAVRTRKQTAEKKVSDEKKGGFSWRKARLMLLLAGALILLAFMVCLFWLMPRKLFRENRRFTLKNVKIDSSGYWQDKEEDLIQELGLKKGINLFSTNIDATRKKLTDIQNVKDAEVRIVMPDTLEIKITEHIPRAKMLGRNGRIIIVNEDGNELKQKSSEQRFNNLPLLINQHTTDNKSALKLIMTVNNNYPDIRIERIGITKQNNLAVYFEYRGRYRYTAVFPNDLEDYSGLLNILQTTILNYGETNKIIDLKYDGNVTLTDAIQ